MIDINDIAALLHVEEKLRAHGDKYRHILSAVRAKLDEHEVAHALAKGEPVVEEIDENDEKSVSKRRL